MHQNSDASFGCVIPLLVFWTIQHVDLKLWIGSCRYVVVIREQIHITFKMNVHWCFITRTIKVFCYTLRSSLKLKPRWHMRLKKEKKYPTRLFFKLQTHAPDNTTARAVSNPPAHPIPLFSPSSADSPFFSRFRHLGAYANVLKICRGRRAPPLGLPPSLPMQKCLLHHVVLDASYYTPPLFHPSNGKVTLRVSLFS